ncbi:MAG: homocysteine S-methyltransferase family protein [Phycisphaerales bacterium]|nr:homocysteine S-methyltransferase family protein [Phycisphaerales bacterium]
MREKLRDVIGQRPLACDGAMGTQLMARGLKPGECGELWNLERVAEVQAIHAAYVAAGCDLITTNTFGATRTSLARHGLDQRVREINRAGALAARAAAGEKAWVLGDVGPFGDFLEPSGDYTPEQLHEIFTEQLLGLHEGGVDGIIIETMVDPAEVAVAAKAAKAVGGDWPIFAALAFSSHPDGLYRTIMGVTAEQAVQQAIAAGANVVGTNCGTGLSLEDYVQLGSQLTKAAGKVPVIVQPNAGAPQQTESGVVYLATPGDMARLARELRDYAHVSIIGGCCGTTPAHMKSMAIAVHA